MRVELVDWGHGPRYEVQLYERQTVYVLSLDEGRKLAKWISELDPAGETSAVHDKGPVQLGRYLNQLVRDGIIGVLQQAVLAEFVVVWRDERIKAEAERERLERAEKATNVLTATDAEGLARVCMSFQAEMVHKQDDIGVKFWRDQGARLTAYAAALAGKAEGPRGG